MQIDKKWLSKVAAQEGFVRDTLEKVCERHVGKSLPLDKNIAVY